MCVLGVALLLLLGAAAETLPVRATVVVVMMMMASGGSAAALLCATVIVMVMMRTRSRVMSVLVARCAMAMRPALALLQLLLFLGTLVGRLCTLLAASLTKRFSAACLWLLLLVRSI